MSGHQGMPGYPGLPGSVGLLHDTSGIGVRYIYIYIVLNFDDYLCTYMLRLMKLLKDTVKKIFVI